MVERLNSVIWFSLLRKMVGAYAAVLLGNRTLASCLFLGLLLGFANSGPGCVWTSVPGGEVHLCEDTPSETKMYSSPAVPENPREGQRLQGTSVVYA